MKSLPTPDYTDEEREKIVAYFFALKVEQIQACLGDLNLRGRTGTKAEVQKRLEAWLRDGKVGYEHIVKFIDSVAPWDKQHVFLYNGPTASIAEWKDPTWISNHLKQNGMGRLLNAHLPLILPHSLRLSSIEHTPEKLRVTAIERREEWERIEEQDEQRKGEAGEHVELRAYVHLVTRGLIAFEWNLVSNTAFLQITQLPSAKKYEDAASRFAELTRSWLDLKLFSLLDICPAIKRLHELEEANTPEARSHGIDYCTLQNRRFSARSASAHDSVLGETEIDEALKRIRQTGVGRLGNFYWLPEAPDTKDGVPSPKEVHVTLFGEKSRINFHTPNTEEVVRHVLSRVRALSA